MSQPFATHIVGLLCAGNGSRLFAGLVDQGEVVKIDGKYCFKGTGKLFEKSLTEIVPQDQSVPGDQGVTILDLAVKDVLLIPGLKTIRFLTNEQSNIPARYHDAIDRTKFLKRLGLTPPQGPDVANQVKCEYLEQPPKSETYPFYGTAWAFHLVSQGVALGKNELMLITETDSAFLHPRGKSVPASMIEAMRDNKRGATAGLSVAPLMDDVDPGNGLGMVLMESESDERYFRFVIESQKHANLSKAMATGLLYGRNTTRVAADAEMLAMNEVTIKTPPQAANNNEYQATDTYNDYADQHPLYVYNNPSDVVWHDMGKFPGLLIVRQSLSGLRDSKHPIWGPAALKD